MFLLEWTASDLLLIGLAAVVMIGTVVWLVPSAKVPRKRHYDDSEITAYDSQIPRYFLAAALALVLGSLHIIIKNIPGFWQWLWEAGYGGHLFRDLSNSHIIIVGGGTVLLTGLTWYVLPRFTNRPLYSNTLASASFWFTLIGVFGFYISWLVLGLIEGNMVRHGWDYMAAKEALGALHRVPTRMTASIMGVGYWTYVLDVFLTVWAARSVEVKPLGHLTKFIVVSAGALFVGTVQGVLQVLPANADWIHYAGKFGEYVDPISHAHINLVTGMLVALGGFLVYFAPHMGGKPVSKRNANLIFWTLVPGSLLFYFTFLGLGLVLGGAVNGSGGIQAPALVPLLSRYMPVLISVAGATMLAGFWVYFVSVWKSLDLRSVREKVRSAAPAGFWLVSTLALVVGTFQGLLQALPATMRVLTVPEEVPNIHAQLNMIGGILLALMGIVYLLLPELVGEQAESRLIRRSLLGVAVGIGSYYIATLVTGIMRYQYLNQGMTNAQAAAQLGWAAPAVLMLCGLPILFGFGAFAMAIYRTTRVYRATMVKDMRNAPARYAGPMPNHLKRIPLGAVLGMEFAGGIFGWPGLGWLYSGKTMLAIALLLAGPGISWALLPMLFSPFSDTIFSHIGWPVLLVWLPLSALISTGCLALVLYRERIAQSRAKNTLAAQTNAGRVVPSQDSTKIRVPRATIFGVAFVMVALFSIPFIPLLNGIPDGGAQQAMMSQLPEKASGAYLNVGDGQQSGLVKLFPWSFPVDTFPQESPAISPDHLIGLVISQKGLDDPSQYQLFDIDSEGMIPMLAQEIDFQKQLTLVPQKKLDAGNYMLDIPTGGMFAGREYYYFRVDPAVVALPPLVIVPDSAPAPATLQTNDLAPTGQTPIWLEVLPVAAALISGMLAFMMVRRMRKKIRPQEVAWAIAFGMFAVAAGAQVVGDLAGWSAWLVRLYYVLGATLVVGWLGLGTWLVLVHKPWLRNAGLWLMLALSGYGIGLVSLSTVDTSQMAEKGWHALVSPLPLTVLTISINSIGTLVLVGGALYSAWVFWRKRIMRERMYGLLLLAVGALVVAAGGSLTRLGYQQYLYIAMSAGVGLMFWGYLLTIRPLDRATAPMPLNPVSGTESMASAGD